MHGGSRCLAPPHVQARLRWPHSSSHHIMLKRRQVTHTGAALGVEKCDLALKVLRH